jgi:hypothetical protein
VGKGERKRKRIEAEGKLRVKRRNVCKGGSTVKANRLHEE